MVIINKSVYKNIRRYTRYIIKENLCSEQRAIEKVTLMIRSLIQGLSGCVTHRLSPYKKFGNPQGYRLYVYKDPKSKTQWGFAYEKLVNGDIIVHGMKNMQLIKEEKIIQQVLSLMERLDNLYK